MYIRKTLKCKSIRKTLINPSQGKLNAIRFSNWEQRPVCWDKNIKYLNYCHLKLTCGNLLGQNMHFPCERNSAKDWHELHFPRIAIGAFYRNIGSKGQLYHFHQLPLKLYRVCQMIKKICQKTLDRSGQVYVYIHFLPTKNNFSWRYLQQDHRLF